MSAGPFETRREASQTPEVRAVYAAMHASTRRGVMAEMGQRLLEDACAAAGVTLGNHDRRILGWLAGFEPETCAVVAGLITRAALTNGQREVLCDALRDASGFLRARDACSACTHAPDGPCGLHREDVERASDYDDLRRQIAGGTS